MNGDQGGTVRYHRAEYRPGSNYPWRVLFSDDDDAQHFRFTAAEGEAMGLTPPPPQATIALADGRSVTIDEDALRRVVAWWGPIGVVDMGITKLNDLFTGTDEATP